MRPRRYGVTVAAWGLSVLLGTAVLYAPGDRAGIAGSLRWLAVLVGVVLGGGLLLHGVRSLRGRADDPRQYRGPAATLAVVGLLAVLGSAWTFRPWPAGGLAGGIQAIGLAAFLVGGGLFVALGVYSYRTRSQRLPLAIVAGLTGAGVFYPVDDSGCCVTYTRSSGWPFSSSSSVAPHSPSISAGRRPARPTPPSPASRPPPRPDVRLGLEVRRAPVPT